MSNGFEDYIAEARRLNEEGDIESAIQMYKNAIDQDSTNEEIRREIINLTLKNGDFQQAVVEYFDWAEASQYANDIDSAIRIYQEILGLDSLLKKKTFTTEQQVSDETIGQVQETIKAASGAIFFNMGYLFLEKNALDDAIGSLQKSLEFNSTDAKTHTLLGQVYMQKEMDKEAIGEFQEVVRLSPDEAAYAYEMLGEIYIQGGKSPQSTIVWFRNAGDLYLKHEQLDDAVRAYERILSFDSKNKEVLTRVGEVYAKLGSKDRAIEILNQLAEIFKEEGLLDKVIAIYERITKFDPDNLEARDKIISIYRKILDMDPSNLTARSKLIGNILRKGSAEEAIPEFLALAETYLEKGMRKESFAVCKKLLDLDAKSARAHELIADIYFSQKDTKKSLKGYLTVIRLYQEKDETEKANAVKKKLRERFPGTKEVTLEMAKSYKEQGQYDLALAEFQKLLASESDDIQNYLNVLEIYEIQRDNKNIIIVAQKIMEMAPNKKSEMREKLVRIYEEKEDKDKLLEIYNEILKEEPGNGDIQEKVLEIYESKGDRDKVINIYKDILNSEPDRVDLREKMIEFYAAQNRLEDVMRESSKLADVFMRNSNVEKAEGLFKNILAFMPGDMNTRENLIGLYEKKNDDEKVQDELLVLAKLGSRKGNIKTAISKFHKMLKYTPKDINIKTKVARLAFSQGDVKEAVGQYRDIAQIYMDKEMFGPAISIVKSILEIDERNIEYRQKLINLLKEQLMYDEAVENYRILLSHYISMHQNSDAVLAARDAIAFRPTDLEFRKDIVELFLAGGDIKNGRVFSNELVDLYLDHGDYPEVIQIYDRISAIYRSNEQLTEFYEYREKIAQIYERQTKFNNAIEEYYHILEGNLIESRLDETNRLFPLIVNLYFKENRSDEAIRVFEDLITKLKRFNKTDESVITLEQIVKIYDRKENWPKAQETLDQIIDIYREMNCLEEVIATYQKKIDLYLRLKNIAQAINEMFKVIEFYLGEKNLNSAMARFEEVERFEPGDSKQVFRMAEILFEYGYYKESKPLYEKVLKVEPDNYDAMARVAIIFAKSGNLQDAVEYTQKIFSKGLVAEVIEAYKKSTEIDMEEAQMHINLGLFYQEMGFIEEAIMEFQEAAKDPQRLLEAYNLMALCFKQEGFIDLAIRQFERALEQPGYPEEEYLSIRYNLGETLFKNGQLQEALSAFYECYMVDINYRDIADKIALLNEQISTGDIE